MEEVAAGSFQLDDVGGELLGADGAGCVAGLGADGYDACHEELTLGPEGWNGGWVLVFSHAFGCVENSTGGE